MFTTWLSCYHAPRCVSNLILPANMPCSEVRRLPRGSHERRDVLGHSGHGIEKRFYPCPAAPTIPAARREW